MEHKIAETNARIDVADVLRGLAVMGIILLHSIEHFNFYSFPEEVPFEWMKFTDQAIWRGLFFTFSNKAYAVFALLFGFSFYIQDNNQQRRGKDFRLRFFMEIIHPIHYRTIQCRFLYRRNINHVCDFRNYPADILPDE